MKKILFSALLLAALSATNAQVGINTDSPQAILDITGKNVTNPSNMDGLLIPRINTFPTLNPTVSQNSMLVYLTVATTSESPFGVNPSGFYYWNFSELKWVGIDTGRSDWSINGNRGTLDGTNFLGTVDNVPLNIRFNNEKAGRIDAERTFYGYRSGNSNFGEMNVGFGNEALYNNSTGSQNTALGSRALMSSTTSSANTAVGFESLYSESVSGENVAVGYQALRNNTTDSNTAIGYRSLFENTTGNSNTAVGREALRNTIGGSSNTAVGREALQLNTTGGNNTASGVQALRNNISGNDNVGIGPFSLYNNTIGSGNVASGINSLYQNTSGEGNTSIGKESMYNNRMGNSNVALGFASLYDNASGNENVAIGTEASRDNSSGSRNVAIGHDASRVNTTGNGNVAVGNFALLTNATGNNNTALGNAADVSAPDITNATALGNGAKVDISNKVRIGNQDVTSIEVQVGLSIASDRRFKDNIVPISLGLDFIDQLTPVEYVKKNDAENRKEWGLIAQDLKQVLKDNHYEGAAIISSDRSKEEYLSIRYDDLLAPIIKSIQELNARSRQTELLLKKVTDQQLVIKELTSRVEDLERRWSESMTKTK